MKECCRAFRAGPVIVVLLLVLLVVRAHGMECLITVNTSDSDQKSPGISGGQIVWEDWNDGAIRLYDLGTGAETKVAPSPMWQTVPAISGSLVAWEEANDYPWFTENITYRNLLTGAAGVLSTDGTSSPTVSGQRIVWVNGTPPGSLSLYTEGDSAPTPFVSNGDPTNEYPTLSGDGVVWVNRSETAIFYKNITTGDELLIASGPTKRINPVISGDLIVWQDKRNTNWDLYLYNLSSGLETRLTTGPAYHTSPAIDGTGLTWVNGSEIDYMDLAGSSSPITLSSVDLTGSTVDMLPKISSDRVVWEKDVLGSYSDIYLFTIGSSDSCPSASFIADHTTGISPLTVRFTDTSSGSPGHWLWEFGDGTTSPDQNPVHTFAADGTYSVSLTVSNAVGRDYTTQADYIRVGPIPVVSFSPNQTYGIAPLPVRFTDTSSGDPTGWSWDFGDTGSSAVQNPVHTYTAPGTYTVSLQATNGNGTGTGSIPGPIRVLNGANLPATTDIDGLQVQTVGSRQEITLDTTENPGYTFDPNSPAAFSFTPPASSGWGRITFSSTDGIGFARDADGIIRGNLSSCTLESRALVPSTFTTRAGNNLPLSYTLQLTKYPVLAEVNATVWEGVIPSDDLAFRYALITKSTQFTSILDTAYTLSFVTTNLSGVQGATLNLSVATSWVQGYGGGNNITVVRLGDDGINEVLNPTATFTDTASNLDYFTVPSPSGLSRFALVSATGSSNLIQMGTRIAIQLIQSSGIGHSSNEFPAAQAVPPAKPPAERPAATYYGEGKIDTTPAGIARDPVIIASADHGASLAIDAGTEAFDSMHEPLTLATAQAVTAGSIPSIPDGTGIRFTGMAYDIGPNGATFNPPATIRFTVPDNQWDANTQYAIRSYSTKTGSWDDIPTSVDTAHRIVSGSVSHLCLFGLFAAPLATPATPAHVIGAPAANPGGQPVPIPRTGTGIFTGLLGWIYATATADIPVSIAVLVGMLASLYAFTRRAWLSRHRNWITLYLISLTGLLWVFFLFTSGGPLWESLFLFTTITGLNLIVHILRFDRIDLTPLARHGSAGTARRR